jgi:hypothetical protein
MDETSGDRGGNSDWRLHSLAMAIAGLGCLPSRVFELPDCVNLQVDEIVARVRQVFIE